MTTARLAGRVTGSATGLVQPGLPGTTRTADAPQREQTGKTYPDQALPRPPPPPWNTAGGRDGRYRGRLGSWWPGRWFARLLQRPRLSARVL